MPMQLDQVVPWGRSFDEYRRMFALSDADLDRRILCCADGPAGFNAEMHARGRAVLSCDPLYAFSAQQIRRRIDQTYGQVLAGARAGRDTYVWKDIPSPEALGRIRMAAMDRFLADFPHGRAHGRYLPMALPHLALADAAFDLALCSHFLFTYSQQLSLALHIASAREMVRVAREVRIFPLLHMDGTPSPYVQAVRAAMEHEDFQTAVVGVPYEFQKGGNQMLVVQRPSVWQAPPAEVRSPAAGLSPTPPGKVTP